MREVDEERDAVPDERTEPAPGLVGIAQTPGSRRRGAVGDPVAVANGEPPRHVAAYASSVDADPVELRVLGCLLEKQRTTPDQYPLSLNALRLACNQTTNRDPVVAYDEREIHDALQRLARRGWTRLASGAGSRAAKYRQLFDDALGLGGDEVAVLCVLMLARTADARRAEPADGPATLLPRARRDPRDARPASQRASSSSGSSAVPARRRSATATCSATTATRAP